jgi:23S rRNA pseudouridine2457 synthase
MYSVAAGFVESRGSYAEILGKTARSVTCLSGSAPAGSRKIFILKTFFSMARLILFNKPFNVLSQFTDDQGRTTLAHFLSAPDCRVAGRLDFDSEGLLLLTDDGQLQQRIANPANKHWKTYLVQVEGELPDTAIAQLRDGITLKDGPTLPARARRVAAPLALWDRNPPVRQRQTVPDSWLELSIREGRNRQVRRMTAAIGFPTLRLVRTRIGSWSLDALQPGQFREVAVHMPAASHRKASDKPQRRSRKK